MEMNKSGVRIRARAGARNLSMVEAENTSKTSITNEKSEKKRKIGCLDEFEISSVHLLKHRQLVSRPENSISPVSSENFVLVSDQNSTSRCSSNDSSEIVNSQPVKSVADLEGESVETESSRNSKGRKRNKGNREFDEFDSMERSSDRNSNHGTIKISEAEIEEFFSPAEKHYKDLRRQFLEKYNYDTKKDVPLEGGRYEWISLKP